MHLGFTALDLDAETMKSGSPRKIPYTLSHKKMGYKLSLLGMTRKRLTPSIIGTISRMSRLTMTKSISSPKE